MQSCTPILGISSGIFQLPMAMAAFGQARLAPTHWVGMGELSKWKSNTLPLFLRGAGPLRAGPSRSSYFCTRGQRPAWFIRWAYLSAVWQCGNPTNSKKMLSKQLESILKKQSPSPICFPAITSGPLVRKCPALVCACLPCACACSLSKCKLGRHTQLRCVSQPIDSCSSSG